jgi:hypothetical protein
MLDPILILDTNDLKRIKKLKEYSLENPIFANEPGKNSDNPKNPSSEDYIKNHVITFDIGFEIDFCIEIQQGDKKFQHLSILHISKQNLKPDLISDLMFLFDMGKFEDATYCMLENNYIIHVMKEIKE